MPPTQDTVTVRAPENPPGQAQLKVTSTTFQSGGTIPARVALNGCGGQNVSPQLSWSGAPAQTKSFAISCFDPDAPTGSGFWHWTVGNIPAGTTSFDENAAAKGLPKGVLEGFTDYGSSGWLGPCPPPGETHRYVFTVYALDIPSIEGMSPTVGGARLVFSMRGHLLAKGSIEGRYGR